MEEESLEEEDEDDNEEGVEQGESLPTPLKATESS